MGPVAGVFVPPCLLPTLSLIKYVFVGISSGSAVCPGADVQWVEPAAGQSQDARRPVVLVRGDVGR